MSAEPPAVIASFQGAGKVKNPFPLSQELTSHLVGFRRHLHQHPEVGFHEFKTANYVREQLETRGLAVSGPIAGTGLYVDIEGAWPGPHVGFRADIDALPIQDAKAASYASRVPGVAHLCGHDAHTAIAMGLALHLHDLRDDLAGSVRIFFQPNEEGVPSGAPLMIRDGVLSGLEAVYAYHVDPTIDVGRFGLINGPATAAADRFLISVKAPSTGHSARPHLAVDTLWITTQILNNLYQLIGRISDARNSAILSVCRIHGGDAFNVIPDHVDFGGTLRCTVETDRELLKQHIIQTAGHVASLYGAQTEVDFDYGAPPVMNAPRLISHVRDTLHDELGPASVFDIQRPSMGAEDFAHYLKHIPGALIRLGTADLPETSHPLHDAHFDIDEHALPLAVRVMARVLMNHTAKRILA